MIKKSVLPIIVLTLLLSGAAAWEPPIGIPRPEFGIEETHMMYKDALYDFGNGPEPYKDAGDGPYTHYVDNTNPSATDDANPYGTADTPRKSIPKTLPAGSVVSIHGGPYNYPRDYSKVVITAYGTRDKPVFICGANTKNVLFTKIELNLEGQYFIVENLNLYDKSSVRFSNSAQHGSIRNCEVHNPPGSGGDTNPTVSAKGSDIVIYKCHIHDNSNTHDVHGIQPSSGAKRVWVLENLIHDNSGDGIQACHRCMDNPPQYIYIGGNDFPPNGENGVDLKYADDIIISQNRFHDYTHSAPSGTVSPIVIGSDGAPHRPWIIFNEIYNSKKSIRIEEVDEAWIIGNIIYGGEGIRLEKKGSDLYIVGNTFHDLSKGIYRTWTNNFNLHVFSNIFSNIGGSSIDINSRIGGQSEFGANLFWQTDPYGKGGIVADPSFVNPGADDFHLKDGSPAIDKGVKSGVYQTFYDLYGIDISVDFDGKSRPAGSGWDIGPFEFGGVTSTCRSSGFKCCDACKNGPHAEFDGDCPNQKCCDECSVVTGGCGGADVVVSGNVDIFDLVAVAKDFGKPAGSRFNAGSDVNGDGDVNIFDLVAIAKRFGELC